MPRRMVMVAVLLVVLSGAGVAIIAQDPGDTTAIIVGGALEGLAGVLLMSLLFYAVGRSEDRARDAERRRR